MSATIEMPVVKDTFNADGHAHEAQPIYLDYSATTPVDPRVAAKMIPYITEHFGDRKSTRLNSSHITRSRMPSSA